MEGLFVVSPAPILPFSVNHPRYLRSMWHTYSGNPVADAKLSGIVRQRVSQQKALANKYGKSNVSPCSCAVWSEIMPGITDTTCLAENCKVPRRKSKKNAKKKRRQSKKLQSNAGLVESGSQAFDSEEHIHVGAAKDTLSQQINWFELDTKASYGNHDSLVSESWFTGLNSVDSGYTIRDVTNNAHFTSPETSAFVENSVSSESSSIRSVEFGTRRNGRKIGRKESSSRYMPMYTQRGNHMNSMPAHGHFGKENLHSVWKKVHKSVESIEKNNNSDFCVTSSEKPRHEGYSHVATKFSAADDSGNFQVNILRVPKNRIAPDSHDKGNFPSRKEYHPKKGRSRMLLKVNQENSRNVNVAAQKNIKQARVSNSRYHTLSNSSRVELHNNKVDITTCTSDPGIKVYPEDLLVSEMILTTNDKIDADNSEAKYGLPTESTDLSNCLDQIQPGQQALKEDDKHLEKEASSSANGTKDYNSGFLLQKWIPVGRNVPCPTGLERPDTSLLLHFKKPDTVDGCYKITTNLSCDSISSVASDVQDPSSIFEKSRDYEEDISEFKLASETMIMSDSDKNIGSLVDRVKEVQILSSDIFLKKIPSAVEETYRVQMESEDVQAAIGTTIAGFEKFLHSACPVILKVDSPVKCPLCHIERAAIPFLCTHELQSVSLRSLWEWYERHGSYGLEVREDRHDDLSKLGHREFGLRAYFVPYLSAVQLFRKCRNGYVSGLKRLRLGIPSPCADTVTLSLPDQVCSLQPCCQPVDNNAITSAGSPGSWELIFEYFESEQPRQRQPLFDKGKRAGRG